MQSIARLHASDESGNASVATVQTVRSALASTIIVDTVEGINATFFGSMGTPHTFVDPVTNEEITVISDATCVDFSGHVDGGNLEIDEIAPGYTDNGSAVGDIVIIRPTSQWADNVADVLEQSLNDDGTPQTSILNPTGMIVPYAGFAAPSGWLMCDAGAYSRSTYAALFALLNPSLGAATMTIASPGVVTLTAHGLLTTDAIFFTTTGALPTGLAINTRYWVIKVDANTFKLATSQANADAGTAINTTGSQSGVHTLHRSPYGVGDGTTTFNTPDMRGRVAVGIDTTQTEFNTLGKNGGDKALQSHSHVKAHQFGDAATSGGFADGTVWAKVSDSAGGTPGSTDTAGTGAGQNLQPYTTFASIIKT